MTKPEILNSSNPECVLRTDRGIAKNCGLNQQLGQIASWEALQVVKEDPNNLGTPQAHIESPQTLSSFGHKAL